MAKKKVVDLFDTWFADCYPGHKVTKTFKKRSLARFREVLTEEEIKDAITKAGHKLPGDPDNGVKYFCGICWNKIKGPESSVIKSEVADED